MSTSVTTLLPVLSAHWDDPDAYTLAGYERVGGYQAARTALEKDPEALIELVRDAGLRGRGGAGFPTGLKWGFIPKDSPNPTYLVVNADESEPGTCKDIPLMMASPHTLVEGVIISSFASRSINTFGLRFATRNISASPPWNGATSAFSLNFNNALGRENRP